MGMGNALASGMVGSAMTMIVRTATRRAMHDVNGMPRLPQAAFRTRSFGTMLVLAAIAGAVLALGDVLKERRSHAARAV